MYALKRNGPSVSSAIDTIRVALRVPATGIWEPSVYPFVGPRKTRAVCWLWELRRGSRSTPCNTGRRICGLRVARCRGWPRFRCGCVPRARTIPLPSRGRFASYPPSPGRTRSTIHHDELKKIIIVLYENSFFLSACVCAKPPSPLPPFRWQNGAHTHARKHTHTHPVSRTHFLPSRSIFKLQIYYLLSADRQRPNTKVCAESRPSVHEPLFFYQPIDHKRAVVQQTEAQMSGYNLFLRNETKQTNVKNKSKS